MEKEELVGLIEALLFASGKMVNIKVLCDVTGCEKGDVLEALNTLKQKYSNLIKLNQKSLEKITSQRKEINKLLHHVKL